MEKTTMGTVCGWKAPCAPFDYRKMEREALRECGLLQDRLRALKQARVKDAESDLLRRREVCMLTDIYYEQRHNARLFHRRAEERERRGIVDNTFGKEYYENSNCPGDSAKGAD